MCTFNIARVWLYIAIVLFIDPTLMENFVTGGHVTNSLFPQCQKMKTKRRLFTLVIVTSAVFLKSNFAFVENGRTLVYV